MLEIRKLNIIKKSEQRELVKDLTFTLNKHDKFAIIGLEGIGKSTMLKVILGEDLNYIDYNGSINIKNYRLGYLPQSIISDFEDVNVIDFLFKNNISDDIDIESYKYYSKLDKTLEYVKFDLEAFDESKTINQFSGGEIVKLGLTKMLLREPDILLLDEPTNNLDLETIIFLEDFILNEERPILFISHDEALLENASNGIIHLVQTHKQTIAISIFEKIGYEEYKIKRKLKLDSQEMIARKQRNNFKKKMDRFRQIYQKVEYQQDLAIRTPAKARLLAKKIKNLKSMESRYAKEKQAFLDIPEREEEILLFFNEEVKLPNNRLVLDYKNKELKIGNRVLSKDVELYIKGPQKICIIGKNGSGKTTLLRDVYSVLKERDNITVGYMSQSYDEQLNFEKSALEYLTDSQDYEYISKVRKMMGALHFTREEMLYKQSRLSGGQKSKLLLLKMVIDNCNVLILDEPTRNLSPLSIPVIHNLLSSFKGAIICVSHDRNFIENVFDDIYILEDTGLKLFNL